MEQKCSKHFVNYHILLIPGFLGHCWDSLIFIVNCNNAPYENNNNTLVSACWKYANNNANSSLGYNIAYFRNSYGIDIFPDVCVKNVIQPPRLDNEKHIIISERNMLSLAKCDICITSISEVLTLSLN